MEWYFNGDLPIYSQLVEQITLRIVTTYYVPGQRLPSVRDLAMEAGVNPNTMQRALGELERRGLMFSQRTSGRYVTEELAVIEAAKQSLAEERIGTFLRGMKELGYTPQEVTDLVRSAQEKEESQ